MYSNDYLLTLFIELIYWPYLLNLFIDLTYWNYWFIAYAPSTPVPVNGFCVKRREREMETLQGLTHRVPLWRLWPKNKKIQEQEDHFFKSICGSVSKSEISFCFSSKRVSIFFPHEGESGRVKYFSLFPLPSSFHRQPPLLNEITRKKSDKREKK